jgi:hypothetical protein
MPTLGRCLLDKLTLDYSPTSVDNSGYSVARTRPNTDRHTREQTRSEEPPLAITA